MWSGQILFALSAHSGPASANGGIIFKRWSSSQALPRGRVLTNVGFQHPLQDRSFEGYGPAGGLLHPCGQLRGHQGSHPGGPPACSSATSRPQDHPQPDAAKTSLVSATRTASVRNSSVLPVSMVHLHAAHHVIKGAAPERDRSTEQFITRRWPTTLYPCHRRRTAPCGPIGRR